MSREKTPIDNGVIRLPDASTPHSASMYPSERVFDALADAWQAGYDAAISFIDGKTPVPTNPYAPEITITDLIGIWDDTTKGDQSSAEWVKEGRK